MRAAFDSTTSLSLLGALCGPETDDAAWRVFHDRYRPMIHCWCGRHWLQAADVADVTQEVLKRVFTKLSTYDSARGPFRSWLKTVVDNSVKSFLRTRSRRPAECGSGDSDVAELLNAIAQPESVDLLVEALDVRLQRDAEESLARVAREVHPDTMRSFRSVVLDGQSIADTANQLGKSYAAVCMAINRVGKKLRAEGEKLGERPRHAGKDQP